MLLKHAAARLLETLGTISSSGHMTVSAPASGVFPVLESVDRIGILKNY